MEIVYNPPPRVAINYLAALSLGDLFTLPKSRSVYMRIEHISGVSQLGSLIAIGLKDGCFYSFSNQEVITLDGKLTVWEV